MKAPSLSINLKEEFQTRFAKPKTIFLVNEVIQSKEQFDELVNIVISNDRKTALGSSWVLGYAGSLRPEWFLARLMELLACIRPTSHPGIPRGIVRVLRDIDIPPEFQGIVTQKCMEWLEDRSQSIAVKAFSLHILSKILKEEPELRHEIKAITESILPYASAGILNAAQKLLKKIERIRG